MKSLMHIANRCAPRKIANDAENHILQALGHSLSYMPFPWKPNSKLLVTINPEDSSNKCASGFTVSIIMMMMMIIIIIIIIILYYIILFLPDIESHGVLIP
jgi:hypothetical protein